MSYEKMMKRTRGHRHDKDFQTIFHNAFEGETNVKSEWCLAKEEMKHTNICYIRVRNRYDEDFIKIPLSFKTEEEATDYLRKNKLKDKYLHGEICTKSELPLMRW